MKAHLQKSLLCAAILSGSSSLFASAWISETPSELIGQGDFDGDGRLDALVLDKETGTVRVGFQDADGQLNWQPSFASGIADATSLTVGRLTSANWDSIAVAGAAANRINKLEPRDLIDAEGVVPTALFPPGIGPNLVAAMDAGGAGNTALADYFITTAKNPGNRFALLRNTGAVTSVLDEGALSRVMTSPNSFEADAGKPRWLAGIFRAGRLSFTDNFQAYVFSTGDVVSQLNVEPPMSGSEFIAHRFDPNTSLAQILFYAPGDTDFTKFQIQQNAGVYSLASSNRFRLSSRLQLLQTLPTTQGARLLAFFGANKSNLTSATIFDFDGVNSLRAVQSYAGNFSSGIVLGNGNVALMSANPSGRSASHQILFADGAGYRLGPSGSLPALHRFSGAANALLFDAEPFVNTAARPRQLFRHADWSTSLRMSPTIRVTGQQFLGTTEGLGSSSLRDFGPPANGVSTGLVNQYFSAISVFSGREAVGAIDGEVRITPPSGHYGEAQRVILTNGYSNWQLYYRLGNSAAWILYAAPFFVLENSTIEAYARRDSDGVVSPIASASYTFNQNLGQQDSDNDGVPDYVEHARGLNPLGGADTDGDGFTDLEELARGTNPSSSASKPSENASLRQAFNRLVTPRPPHPNTGAASRPISNVAMRAFTLGGAFLGLANTSAANGSGTTNPAALFVNLTPEPGSRFIVETTPNHFDISGLIASRVGRELIGLVPIPPTNSFTVPYTLGNGSQASEAANWIAAASNAVKTAQNPTVSGLLTYENALVAALFERHAAKALLGRGEPNATNATLFNFRAGDSDRRVITAEDLRNLEQYAGPNRPGYKQQTVFEFLNDEVRNNSKFGTLQNFAHELWRISAAENNRNEGDYPLPYDELRRLLSGASLSDSYLSFPSIATNLANVSKEAAILLAAVPARPQTNLTLTVASAGANGIRLETPSGARATLMRFDETPFVFPPNLQLLPGARVRLFGHADLPAPADEAVFEVISIALSGVPMPSPGDADGNLLVDSWEELFFGGTGVNAFADADSDGYSNLEEMLAGTQPDDALMIPPGAPINLLEPLLILNTESGQLKFQLEWPANLMNRFQIGLEASNDVGGLFTPINTPPWTTAPDGLQEIRLPSSGSPAQFYYLTMKFLQ